MQNLVPIYSIDVNLDQKTIANFLWHLPFCTFNMYIPRTLFTALVDYIIADHMISQQGLYLYCLSISVHVCFLSKCQLKPKYTHLRLNQLYGHRV